MAEMTDLETVRNEPAPEHEAEPVETATGDVGTGAADEQATPAETAGEAPGEAPGEAATAAGSPLAHEAAPAQVEGAEVAPSDQDLSAVAAGSPAPPEPAAVPESADVPASAADVAAAAAESDAAEAAPSQPLPEPTTMAELLASMPAETAEEAALAAGERRQRTAGELSEEGKKAARRGRPRLKLGELVVGADMRGKVVGVSDFGAFVDIGAVTDGLVHVSELSQRRVRKVEDVIKQGDTVDVWVKEIDLENGRVALSMRPRNLRAIDTLQPGETLQGTVTSLTQYGAFVDIGADTEGLVHVSEVSNRRVARPEDVLKVGDAVEVWVKEIDVPAGRVSLSMRSRDLRPIDSLEKGETFAGTVTSVANYGAFVDFGAETDGLVHVSEMADRRVAKPEDAAKVGDTVTVWVKDVDIPARRVSLSMRTRPSRPIATLQIGDVVEGTVTSVTKYGLFVNIGSDTEGLVHVSAMGSGFVKDPAEYVKPGETVEVRVNDVDIGRSRISLSMVGLSSDVGGEITEAQAPEPEAEEEYEAEPEEEQQPTAMELALRKALGEDEAPAAPRPEKAKRPAKKAPELDSVYARMLEQYRQSKQS